MCGVVAYSGDSSLENIHIFLKLLVESQIRGKHATGVSYIHEGQIKTLAASLCAKEFVTKNGKEIIKDLHKTEFMNIIGHTRYSTSDLLFNQPIATDVMSIVLNGVITQKDSILWHKDFRYHCLTKNDAEIVLRYLMNNNLDILKKETVSMAFALLEKSGVNIFRNGKRPLYIAGRYVASTKNILARVGLKGTLIEPFKLIALSNPDDVVNITSFTNRDYQHG